MSRPTKNTGNGSHKHKSQPMLSLRTFGQLTPEQNIGNQQKPAIDQIRNRGRGNNTDLEGSHVNKYLPSFVQRQRGSQQLFRVLMPGVLIHGSHIAFLYHPAMVEYRNPVTELIDNRQIMGNEQVR